MIKHLRANAVAYLALAVALGTGTAYAAGQIANGSVTTAKLAKDAVTSPKIKKSAVRTADVKDGNLTGADIKDGSITAADLAAGVGGGGSSGIQAFAVTTPGLDPVASPDGQQLGSYEFTAAAAGKVYVRLTYRSLSVDCTAGSPDIGLYLDGQPVLDTGQGIPDNVSSIVDLVGVRNVTAGDHEFEAFPHCATGDFASFGGINTAAWTIFVIPD